MDMKGYRLLLWDYYFYPFPSCPCRIIDIFKMSRDCWHHPPLGMSGSRCHLDVLNCSLRETPAWFLGTLPVTCAFFSPEAQHESLHFPWCWAKSPLAFRADPLVSSPLGSFYLRSGLHAWDCFIVTRPTALGLSGWTQRWELFGPRAKWRALSFESDWVSGLCSPPAAPPFLSY